MIRSIVLVAALIVPAVAYGQEISTDVYETSHTQAKCMGEAEDALKGENFDENSATRGRTVEGENGDYKAQVRCGDNSVTVVVTGPNRQQARTHRDAIGAALKK